MQSGGQLAVYTHSPASGSAAKAGYLAGEPALLVAPLAGRLVVFDSALDHEVLPAHAPRSAVLALARQHFARPLTSAHGVSQTESG